MILISSLNINAACARLANASRLSKLTTQETGAIIMERTQMPVDGSQPLISILVWIAASATQDAMTTPTRLILKVWAAHGTNTTKTLAECTTMISSTPNGTAVLADSEDASMIQQKLIPEVMDATGTPKTLLLAERGTQINSGLSVIAVLVPESEIELGDNSNLTMDNEFDYFDTSLH